MATYPEITTLAAWAAVISDPTDSEDANKLAQVDLQTRKFVNTMFNVILDSTTNKIKPGVIADATLAGTIKGSTSNTGTEQGIDQGTVSTPDLRDLAVSTAKIADDAITTAKIADLQITTDLLAANAVTAAKITNATITDVQLATDAVTTAKIDDDAVTTAKILAKNVTAAKIADNVVSGDQLIVGSAEGQLLVAGANPYKFAVKAMSGDATITKDGVVTLVSKNECELVERANNTTACGASAAATWQVRGLSTNCAWTEAWRVPTAAFATFANTGKITLPVGTFIITATAPAHKAGRHIGRLVRYNVGDAVQETFYGAASVATAAEGDQSWTTVKAKITVAAANDYLQFEHYTELLQAADGLGYPSSSGGTYEVYASVHIRQIA